VNLAVAGINSWNRISIATRNLAGIYEPPKKKELQLASGSAVDGRKSGREVMVG